jgi:hypothetical protein
MSESNVFTELDWNNRAVEEVKEKGRNALGATKYQASKVLAEKGWAD